MTLAAGWHQDFSAIVVSCCLCRFFSWHVIGVIWVLLLLQGFLFNTSVNEEILLLGLGRTAPLHGLDPRSRLYWRLHTRLLKCELRAERKGQGLWKQPSLREKLTHTIRNNTVITAMRRIREWVSRTKHQWWSWYKLSCSPQTHMLSGKVWMINMSWCWSCSI